MMVSDRAARRRNGRKKTRVNFSAIFVIIILAILAGYFTTRFVVYPLLGGTEISFLSKLEALWRDDKPEEKKPQLTDSEDTQKTESQAPAEQQKGQGGIVEDGLTPETQSSAETTAEISGYAIQFGSFSTREAADGLIAQLLQSGISAEIVEKDGTFKVLGPLFPTKEEAVSAMQQLDRTVFTDVFVTAKQGVK